MGKTTTGLPKFGRSAEVRAESFDEADNTIEVVWTTGAAVRRYDWRHGRYYQEILEVTPKAVRLDRLNAGAPFLDTHDDWNLATVLGAVVPGSARIDGGKGYAKVKLSRSEADRAAVEKIKDGIIRNISVGYAIHKVIKTDADGDGADDEWRVVDWEPLEISAVPVPADAGSQIRKDDQKVEFACEFVVEHRTPDVGEATEASLADTENTVVPSADVTSDNNNNNQEDARVADTVIETRADKADDAKRAKHGDELPKETAVDVAAAVRKAQEDERKRVAEIRKLGKEAGETDLADAAIDNGDSVDAFRSALLEALMKREAPAVDNRAPAKVGEEHHEKRAKLMLSAIANRADGSQPLIEGANEYRGFTLLDFAREALEVRGERTRGMSRDEIAARALQQRSAYHSTSDFPIILGNVINTTLRAAYEAAPQTWRPFTQVTTVADFKSVHRTQLGEAPRLEKVNEHGEFKRGTMGEAKESYSIATYGKVIGLTRQSIINDDMSAFNRIPRAFGVSVAQLESDLVYAQILGNPTMGDNKDLFHADHSNYVASTGKVKLSAATAATGISLGRKMMAVQTGLDGKTVLNITPSYLLAPVGVEAEVEKLLYGSVYAAKKDDVVPQSVRSLTPIFDARLDNGLVNPTTGATISGDADNWYLIASPSMIDTVELAYLEGQQGMFTETRTGFDVDGLEVKVRFDAGAKVIDWRGFHMNVGD